jgi:hypothetical protein
MGMSLMPAWIAGCGHGHNRQRTPATCNNHYVLQTGHGKLNVSLAVADNNRNFSAQFIAPP